MTDYFPMWMLDADGTPVPCSDAVAWAQWFERATKDRSRIVAADRDEGPDGAGILVSTVFLGIDHRFGGGGPPILWESLVFGGPLDQTMRRYSSRDAALAGHQSLCKDVIAASQK